ncbi:MAG: hypothetical protein ACOC6F_02330 [bacterium]
MIKSGAPAALQGYRLQAIYTLTRVFEPGVDGTQVFQPEGTEDLDITDVSGRVCEVIQVKSYSGLVLSNLEPAKATSFFRRAANLLERKKPPIIRLVNFGSIGPELSGAWEGHKPHRRRVISKLLDKGFTRHEINGFFEHIELVSLTEEEARQEVLSQVRRLSAGIDPENALNLFTAWYLRLAERRETVTCAELVDKVNTVSRFLADRYHYHQEWYTTIEPLEASPVEEAQLPGLRHEFHAGVGARYEHIVAGLDFERAHKIEEIYQAFRQESIVIVHAASGQGKSTLAYRYLHDRYPEKWRFQVKRVQDVEHALSIGLALSGFANAVQVPVAVYLDVHPRDTEWPELVSRLSEEPLLEVLVTVREEDYRRANVSGADLDFVEVSLDFDQAEAKLLYERARSASDEWDFLDFDAAWDAFDREGPLMEFVYLLTQTETLQQRLKGQVQRIEAEVRRGEASPDELRLLSLVAVTSAYGGRLRTRDVVDTLDLPAPNRALKQFEQEYLLRRTTGGMYLEGLHPIRSKILSSLLIQPDINPWLETARSALRLIVEDDLETFILHTLVDEDRETVHDEFVDVVMSLRPITWAGTAGLLRSLLWIGAREYVDDNRKVLDAAYEELGPAWRFAVDLNFALPGEGPDLGEWWTSLGSLIPKERQARIAAIRDDQTPKDRLFHRARAWLRSLSKPPASPSEPRVWQDVAEVWYWAARLAPGASFVEWVEREDLDASVSDLPVRTVADLSLALHVCDPEQHPMWLEAHKDELHRRLAYQHNILELEEASTTLKIHFIPSGEVVADASDALHGETVAKIDLVRRLFPGYERYGSQGYAFHLAGIELPQGDSTRRGGIPATHLLPKWLVWLNSVVAGIAQLRYRPDSWEEYVDSLLEIREAIVERLDELNQGLVKYYQRTKPINVGSKCVDLQAWQHCLELLSGAIDLPRTAVDPWGFADENAADPSRQQAQGQQEHVPIAIVRQKYKPCLEAQREYFSSLRNFLNQAPAIWVSNANAGRLHPSDPRRQAIVEALDEQGIKPNPSLTIHNLFKSKVQLRAYQGSFRRLFGSYLDETKMAGLEKRECEVLTLTWSLWYHYACKPWMEASSPRWQVQQWMDEDRREVKSHIQRALQATQTPECHTELLDYQAKWLDSRALWVTFDLSDPTQLHTSILGVFLTRLRHALGDVELGSLTYYILQETCQYIVIIPLVRGCMLDGFVRPIHTMTVLRTKNFEEKPWAYFLHELPDRVREELDLQGWKLPGIDMANQLSGSLATLYHLAAQIAEFQELPELPELGMERLQTYVQEELSETMSISLQAFFDAAEEICERFNVLSQVEQQERQELRSAVEALTVVHEEVLPGEGDGTFVLDLAAITAYSARLEEVYPIVEGIRLFWIADILNTMG